MKVMEIRDHHSAAPKESKLRKLITIGLGLALSFGIGAYIGHTASQEANDIGGNEDIQPGQRLIIKF